MSDEKRIGPVISQTEVVRDWCFDNRLSTSERNRLAANWFGAGLSQWGKQSAFAESIGVPHQHLSEMLAGSRVVYLRHALPLLGADAMESAQAFIGWACERSRLALPAPLNEVVLTASEARTLERVRRRMAGMWEFFGAELAATEYRCSLDLLDAAIDGALQLGK